MILDRWYAVCASEAVRLDRPQRLVRLGQALVLWRDGAGQVVGAPDRCPHKGARLSAGRVANGELSCPYHGFRFAAEGRCTHIPVHPERPIPAAMRLEMLSLAEAHGLVWLWHGRREGADPGTIPWFPGFPWPDRHASSGALVYPVHYSRLIESNFDVYHFPFVHRSLSLDLGARIEDLKVTVEGGGESIQTQGMMVSERGKKTPFAVDFLAPNVQRLSLLGIDAVLVATPIDAQSTWLWGRYRQSWTRVWPVSQWLSALSLWLEWQVVQGRQDIPVLRDLTPREAEVGACVWVGADAGAARYAQWRSRQARQPRLYLPEGAGHDAAAPVSPSGA